MCFRLLDRQRAVLPKAEVTTYERLRNVGIVVSQPQPKWLHLQVDAAQLSIAVICTGSEPSPYKPGLETTSPLLSALADVLIITDARRKGCVLSRAEDLRPGRAPETGRLATQSTPTTYVKQHKLLGYEL